LAQTLSIFVDESGNFDFSRNGTRYFFLSAVSTVGCQPLPSELHALKHAIAAGGSDLHRFHTTEDEQAVRDQVFEILTRHVEHKCFHLDTIITEKNKANPAIRAIDALYPKILKVLLQYVLNRWDSSPPGKILVWTDQIEVKAKRKAVEKAIKTYLANDLRVAVPYHLYHHPSASEPWLQVADYCCWAIHKKWTDGELRPYGVIQRMVMSEFEIFAAGTTTYY